MNRSLRVPKKVQRVALAVQVAEQIPKVLLLLVLPINSLHMHLRTIH